MTTEYTNFEDALDASKPVPDHLKHVMMNALENHLENTIKKGSEHKKRYKEAEDKFFKLIAPEDRLEFIEQLYEFNQFAFLQRLSILLDDAAKGILSSYKKKKDNDTEWDDHIFLESCAEFSGILTVLARDAARRKSEAKHGYDSPI